MRAEIKREVEGKVSVHPGVADVKISWGEMNADERSEVMTKARWNARQNAPDTEVPLSCKVLAIASGKGGVGKSSVTVNLAASLASKGHTVGVLDADIWGFSLPRMLGANHPPVVIDQSIIPPVAHGVKVMSMDYFVGEDKAVVWRGPMLHKAIEQFLKEGD